MENLGKERYYGNWSALIDTFTSEGVRKNKNYDFHNKFYIILLQTNEIRKCRNKLSLN